MKRYMIGLFALAAMMLAVVAIDSDNTAEAVGDPPVTFYDMINGSPDYDQWTYVTVKSGHEYVGTSVIDAYYGAIPCTGDFSAIGKYVNGQWQMAYSNSLANSDDFTFEPGYTYAVYKTDTCVFAA